MQLWYRRDSGQVDNTYNKSPERILPLVSENKYYSPLSTLQKYQDSSPVHTSLSARRKASELYGQKVFRVSEASTTYEGSGIKPMLVSKSLQTLEKGQMNSETEVLYKERLAYEIKSSPVREKNTARVLRNEIQSELNKHAYLEKSGKKGVLADRDENKDVEVYGSGPVSPSNSINYYQVPDNNLHSLQAENIRLKQNIRILEEKLLESGQKHQQIKSDYQSSSKDRRASKEDSAFYQIFNKNMVQDLPVEELRNLLNKLYQENEKLRNENEEIRTSTYQKLENARNQAKNLEWKCQDLEKKRQEEKKISELNEKILKEFELKITILREVLLAQEWIFPHLKDQFISKTSDINNPQINSTSTIKNSLGYILDFAADNYAGILGENLNMKKKFAEMLREKEGQNEKEKAYEGIIEDLRKEKQMLLEQSFKREKDLNGNHERTKSRLSDEKESLALRNHELILELDEVSKKLDEKMLEFVNQTRKCDSLKCALDKSNNIGRSINEQLFKMKNEHKKITDENLRLQGKIKRYKEIQKEMEKAKEREENEREKGRKDEKKKEERMNSEDLERKELENTQRVRKEQEKCEENEDIGNLKRKIDELQSIIARQKEEIEGLKAKSHNLDEERDAYFMDLEKIMGMKSKAEHDLEMLQPKKDYEEEMEKIYKIRKDSDANKNILTIKTIEMIKKYKALLKESLIVNFKEELKALKYIVKGAEIKIKELESILSKKLEEFFTTENPINEHIVNLIKLSPSLPSYLANNSYYKKIVDYHLSEIQSKNSLLTSLNEQIENYKKQIEDLEKKSKEIEKKLEVSDILTNAENKNYEKNLEEKDKEIEKINQELRKLQENLNNEISKKNSIEETLRYFKAEVESLRKQNQIYHEDLEIKCLEILTAKQKLEKMQDEINSKSIEIEALKIIHQNELIKLKAIIEASRRSAT
ncbi:hypothetical protein SteCoe_6738 [Stentor coeruleus]|uniref:Uncharacterized protein n=1 Tax=Stentor coeruleus TaxID=5963 RepID=A0A1R2CPE4_9CILI|nr:hypothetical protein SteCoe_6738 [Stentor coeruleus]